MSNNYPETIAKRDRSEAPRVSVVIPLYNSRQWINGALDCLLRQTYPDFEILIVDDGGTDDGASIARKKRDSRISVLRQENRGLAGARNTGIRKAKGTYIAFLDADDLWHESKLEKHVALLDSDSETGVTFNWSALIDQQGKELGMVQKPRSNCFTPAFIFCRNPIGNGSSPIIRRNVLDRIEFSHPQHGYSCWFDESFLQSEDIECWTCIALTVATKFSCINESLTYYRISPDGLSANTDNQFESWTRFHDKMALIDPNFVAKTGPLARAYQLRYLARRAIYSGKGPEALKLFARAMASSPSILTQEPGRTLVTGAGAAAATILPQQLLWFVKNHLKSSHTNPAAPHLQTGQG